MRTDGRGRTVQHIVSLGDSRDPSEVARCKQFGVDIFRFRDVIEAGSLYENAPAFHVPGRMDAYLFSYTSGTTGDPKGVKTTHNMVVKQAMTALETLRAAEGDAVISYLPYPHVFEQMAFAAALMLRLRIGFYQGDPLKLVEDCGRLKPAFFPSVPRLYTRIYSRIKGQFD